MTQASAGAMQENAQVQRNRRGRFKPGVSGNPSGRTTSKRFTQLFDAMAADFGGAVALSAIDHALLMQVVGLLIRSERARDADVCVRCANAASRLLAALNTKRQRQPAPVESFADIAARAQAAATARRAIELAADAEDDDQAADTPYADERR